MPLISPVLDDRGFDALFAELRDRIAVYNPEWTDHHDSDVGITLLQLFAYLGEGLQFRLNQVPEATYLAYLKLLGIPMRPAASARALLRADSKVPHGVVLYAGDQAKAGKTLFTLTQDATVWPLEGVAVNRRSLLSRDDLARPERVRAFIAALDPGVRSAVQGSVDAVRLAQEASQDDTEDDAQDAAQPVAPYETLTLAADGRGPALDFADSVDGCVWIAVLAGAEAKIPPALLADPAAGLQRVAGRTLPLSVGFSPAHDYPTLADAQACAPASGPTLQWQASLAAPAPDGSPRYIPLRVAGDTTLGFTQEGVVRLELPADLAPLGVPAAPAGLEGTGEFPPTLDDDRAERLWFWLRVWRGDGSRIGAVQWLALNALACEQVAAAQPQLLGTGNGQPDQAYTLAAVPVVLDDRWPVTLQVEEQGVWQDWTRVDNLDDSRDRDRHYTLDAESGTVRFGLRLPQLGQRIRVLGYHTGGGSAGNLPPGAIDKLGNTLASPTPAEPLRRPAQVSGLAITNPLAAHGGLDAETLDAALRRIPTELRRNRRAVARDDFASLALETPGTALGRAECLPLFHAPSRLSRPGCVSVVVWPANDPQHPQAPRPDAWELAQVCRWLDRWRLVTTELYVVPPSYRRIAIAVAVKVQDGYGLDAVRDFVEQLLRQYLAPLPPYGPEGHGWPLGRRVLARELEGVAMQVEGVDYIESLRLDVATPGTNGQPETWAPVAVLPLSAWELPELAAVTVVDDATPLPPPGSGLNPPVVTPPVPVPVMKEEC